MAAVRLRHEFSAETFPGLLAAKIFNFKREEFFELKEAAEREAVAAKF